MLQKGHSDVTINVSAKMNRQLDGPGGEVVIECLNGNINDLSTKESPDYKLKNLGSITNLNETRLSKTEHVTKVDRHTNTDSDDDHVSPTSKREHRSMLEISIKTCIEGIEEKDKLSSVLLRDIFKMEESDVDSNINNTCVTNDNKKIRSRASCICKCDCGRNFQKHGLGRKSLSKSRKYNADYNGSELISHSKRNTTVGVIKTSESNQEQNRTRLKSDNYLNRSNCSISESVKLCIGCACLRLKTKMAKIVCYGVLLMLLGLCGGVLMVHLNVHKSDGDMIQNLESAGFKSKAAPILSEEETSILLDQPFKSISKDVFNRHLLHSRSAADLLRVFFSDSSLTEEQVNSIMYMKQHNSEYGSTSIEDGLMMDDGNEVDEQNYRELAYQHYVDFQKNPLSDCHDPMPEVIRMDEINSDSVLHFLPSCTIVHRCRNNTACCPRGHICAPKIENGFEMIEKFFMVLESVPGDDKIRPAKDFIFAKTFINHTACECQKVEVETNCRKQCPHHFTKERPGADCECKCSTGHRKCHKIHKGLLPLDEKDLECIKEDKCIVPSCHSGIFSISTGFCPHFRRFRKGR